MANSSKKRGIPKGTKTVIGCEVVYTATRNPQQHQYVCITVATRPMGGKKASNSAQVQNRVQFSCCHTNQKPYLVYNSPQVLYVPHVRYRPKLFTLPHYIF